MRVVLNVDAIVPPLTGIGRYALELARGLQASNALEDLRFFSAYRFLSRPDAALQANTSLAWARRRVPAGIVQVNTHGDIMDWNARAFAGEGAALGFLVAHLKARLAATADPDEPSGVLSHHLAHDEAAWGFLAKLLLRLRAHPAARACDPHWMLAGMSL